MPSPAPETRSLLWPDDDRNDVLSSRVASGDPLAAASAADVLDDLRARLVHIEALAAAAKQFTLIPRAPSPEHDLTIRRLVELTDAVHTAVDAALATLDPR